jgi:formate dehydrogenase major subunit
VEVERMGVKGVAGSIRTWPAVRQLVHRDPLGQGADAFSARTEDLSPRTRAADKVVKSICPYCGVGCGQVVYVQKGRITDIEGDPDSPISRGRLCPKGAATFQLVTGSQRVKDVLYRRPGGTGWETIPLERAMEMVADRVKKVRDETWEDTSPEGHPLRRTLGLAHLGGATLDNEENYLLKKLYTALGAIQIENQARI